MNRVGIKIATLLLLLGVIPAAAAAELPAFSWGETADTVAEEGRGELVLRGERRVVRHAVIAGVPMTLNYRFDTDGLWQVRYFNRARYDDPGHYLRDYDDLRQNLEDRFGEPEKEVTQWRDDQLEQRPEYHGQAVQVGHLQKMAGWKTEQATVLTTLDNESYRPIHETVITDPARRR